MNKKTRTKNSKNKLEVASVEKLENGTYNEPWTKEDDDRLKELFAWHSDIDLALIFNRTISAIKNRGRKFGLKKDPSISGKKLWTDEEVQKFKKLYPDTKTEKLAEIFKVSRRAIYSRAYTLNLEKSDAYIKRYKRESAKRVLELGQKYRFDKGHVPANKGQKMKPEQYERVKHTFFKKGRAPINEKEDGSITVRKSHGKPYKWIRISKNNWRMLNRYVWELQHGPIPDGKNIIFKDGDTLNCAIENLKIISNEENMKRNTIHNYPEEIQQNIRLLSKLKRVIKTKSEEL